MMMSYVKVVLVTCTVVLLLFIGIGIYIQPVSGDLARLGYFAERDFGWNARQPAIAAEVSNRAREASVIVLGDSFSGRGAWQAVAMSNSGRTFRTFFWSDVGESSACVEEWLSLIKRAYPQTRFFLVETVERMFIARFDAKKVDCDRAKNRIIKWQGPSLPALRPVTLADSLPDPVYAVVSLINTPLELDRPKVSGLSIVTPLTRRDLFSSRRSDLLIFFDGDISLKSTWNLSAIHKAATNVRDLQESAKRTGITLIVLVVPDKSTVYSKYVKFASPPAVAPDVWEELRREGVTQVDLRTIFSAAIPASVDLYLPDDTHVGNMGYLLMGNAVSGLLGGAGPELSSGVVGRSDPGP